jgi:hypothetical protein
VCRGTPVEKHHCRQMVINYSLTADIFFSIQRNLTFIWKYEIGDRRDRESFIEFNQQN